MANVLEIILRAKDEATAQLKGMSTALKNTKQIFSDLGTLLTIGIAAKGFQTLLKAYADQEIATTKLNAALKSTGHYTAALSKDLQDFASQMQETTLFADDQILSVEALLAAYKLSPDVIKQATKASMDLAAATGTDLVSAGRLMARAAVGETAQLKRYGLMVDETKLKSQGFTAVLEQVASQFGGTAESIRTSGVGPVKAFQNAVSDAMETAAVPFITILNTLADAFMRLPKFIQIVTVAITTLTPALIVLGPILQKLGFQLTMLLGPWGLLTQAIMAALVALDLWYRAVDKNLTKQTEYASQLKKQTELRNKDIDSIKSSAEAEEVYKAALEDAKLAIKSGSEDAIRYYEKRAKEARKKFDELKKTEVDLTGLTEEQLKEREKLEKEMLEASERRNFGAYQSAVNALDRERERRSKDLSLRNNLDERYAEERKKITDDVNTKEIEKEDATAELDKQRMADKLQSIQDLNDKRLDIENMTAEQVLDLMQRQLDSGELTQEQEYAMRKAYDELESQLPKKRSAEEKAVAESIGSAFASSYMEIMKGNMSLQEGFATAWENIKNIVLQKIEEMIAGEIAKALIETKIAAAVASIKSISAHAGIPFPFGLAMGLAAAAAMASEIHKRQSEIPRAQKGAIIKSPTQIIAGEAGPEAIIPLDKMSSVSGGNISVQIPAININLSLVGELSKEQVDYLARKIGDNVRDKTIDGVRLAQRLKVTGDNTARRAS
jgi:hypothetical protein